MKYISSIKNIFDPYSDQIIRTYLETIYSDIKNMNDAQEQSWMRADLLTSKLYSCNLNGENVSLKDVLFGTKSLETRQNIIVVMGKKHIGKKYFVEKLLEVCKESVKNEKRNLEKAKSIGEYRIPIVINYEWYKKNAMNLKLEELLVSVIEEKCISVNNAEKRHFLKKSVEKMLAEGRFFIYFEGKCWLKELEEELKRILNYGKIIENYRGMAKYHNLVILTVDSEADVKESFLNDNNHMSIKLNVLTVKEVKAYLGRYLPESLRIIEKDNDIMKILQSPEHLKMFEDLHNKKLIEIENQKVSSDKFEFYDYFIRANIRKKLKDSQNKNDKFILNSGRENAIFNSLQQYAVDFYLGNPVVKKNPSQFFSFSDFYTIGLLDERGEFVYPSCGYYLVTKYIVSELLNKQMKKIPECLLEEPLEVVLFWTSELLKNIEIFTEFWDIIYTNSSCKLLLLAKIAKKSNFQNEFLPDIYDKAFLNIKEDFYDYTVLEAFEELNDNGAKYLKRKYYQLDDYDEKFKNNIKKRSVYFLGISHNGIVEKMLDELMDKNTDEHLTYHIIRAAVENYGVDEHSTNLIQNRFDELISYCGRSEDPIIKSDFCLLCKKVVGVEWMSDEGLFLLADELIKRMDDNVYWVRAHAAGAIGRRNIANAYTLLLNQVKKELELIYKKEGNYRNSIKVISYSIESICELSDNIEQETKEIIDGLVKLIDMNKLGDQDVEDAYSTIATGIEYMINADKNKLPFNLGGRFRNRIISYQKVLMNTFKKLDFFLEAKGEEVEEVKEKIERLEEIMSNKDIVEKEYKNERRKKVRILHLSDWHFTEKNADNNLIIEKIKNSLKQIDILVITGDLKQFGENYNNTLSILRELKEGLELETSDIFMVPGNHDCDDYKDKDKIIKEIRSGIFKDKECYRKYLDELYQGFQAYETFLKEFYGEQLMQNGGMHNKLIMWKDCLNILSMNTALVCDEDTEKNKIVDIEELTEIKKKDDKPTLCISHHKLSQLYLEHEDTIKAVFGNLKVSVMLSGDIHRSKKESIHINDYEIPNFVCGKFLGNPSDNWSSRNIVIYEIDLDEKTLMPNLYKWDRSKFAPDNEFGENSGEIEDKWEVKPVKLL